MKRLLLVLTFLLAAATAHAQTATVVLQWLPQAQFAGFYVAKEKGFYAERDVDLTLISGGPDVITSELLESRRATFATMFLSTGIQRRAAGIPIVNIAQLAQHSGMMLLAKKSSGINGIFDLYNRKVGLWANEFQLQPRALFRRSHIDVKVVPTGSSLDLFLLGGVDATSAMTYNEYHRLYTYGIDFKDLTVFHFADIGLDFPEDGLYALEETARRQPELCRKVVEATMEGWAYAFKHKDEALQYVQKEMESAHIPFALSHQRWMLDEIEKLFEFRDGSLSIELREADYDFTVRALRENGFIRTSPAYADFRKEVLQ
ncbi:ABC transporter substrate-binding protein [Salidesulfovibrio brasiliensis]